MCRKDYNVSIDIINVFVFIYDIMINDFSFSKTKKRAVLNCSHE